MQDTEQPITNDTLNDTPRPQKKRTALYITIFLLIIAILAPTLYYLVTKDKTEAERVAYEILEDNIEPKDYEEFLAKYPNSEYAEEVKTRLKRLQQMLLQWERIALSDRVSDFENFKNTFNDIRFNRRCDLKIDSLDFIRAQREGSPEAFDRYLASHPEGLYASEASIAQSNLRDQEITPEDRGRIIMVLNDFYKGFEEQDETTICQNISSTMTSFLSKKDATKATVMKTIKGMFNEHILSCSFVVNRDMTITRKPGTDNTYIAVFTVDQHIERDNEGKTFGSYKVTAEINNNLLITSLVMEELSRQ